jgi:LacI family transcriptional regulator
MHDILNNPVKPTAIFCMNDDMAVGAMKSIYEAGLKIPEDFSLIGFDDSIFASYLSPSLTSVSRPIEMLSARGAEILLNLIHGEKKKVETIYLRTELKIRESVRDLGKK